MNHLKRILSAGLATCCLLFPALAEDDISAANFEPDEAILQEGAHGEVDQSDALNLPTVEPLETYDANESEITQEDIDLADGITYDGESEGAAQDDDYVDASDILPDDDPSGIRFDNDTEPNQIAAANDGMPLPTDMPVVDVSSIQFSALTDASLGFTFNYPSAWENIPGLHTVCFREIVDAGDFPARIAISVKRMDHSVEKDVLMDQLTSFMRVVSKQYSSSSFQAGKVNTEDSFMGRRAFSNTYLAYQGETEIEGFIIGCAIGKAIVVGHFSATYEDYQSMYNVMRYMINSAQLLTN